MIININSKKVLTPPPTPTILSFTISNTILSITFSKVSSYFILLIVSSDFTYFASKCDDNIGSYLHYPQTPMKRDSARDYCRTKDSSFLPTVTEQCKIEQLEPLKPQHFENYWIGLKDKKYFNF